VRDRDFNLGMDLLLYRRVAGAVASVPQRPPCSSVFLLKLMWLRRV
jgi:hypothetical protein